MKTKAQAPRRSRSTSRRSRSTRSRSSSEDVRPTTSTKTNKLVKLANGTNSKRKVSRNSTNGIRTTGVMTRSQYKLRKELGIPDMEEADKVAKKSGRSGKGSSRSRSRSASHSQSNSQTKTSRQAKQNPKKALKK